MRRLLTTITLLFTLSLLSSQAQQGFSVGVGGGPNYFFGSISESENTSFSLALDGRYSINSQFFVGVSYVHSHLQASRYNDNNLKTLYFDTPLNALNLHLGLDLLSTIQNTGQDNALKILLDVGAGFAFFNHEAYEYDPGTRTFLPDDYHNAEPHTSGTAIQFNVGGEISYQLTNDFSVYFSSIGHIANNSDLDGYNRYLTDHDNDDATPKEYVDTYNDLYYTAIVGMRYNFGGAGSGGGGRSYGGGSNQKISGGKFIIWGGHGSIFQNFRFDRFSGKKTPSSSIKTNRNKSVQIFSGGRWQNRKSGKASLPKKSRSSRFLGRKSDNNLPK